MDPVANARDREDIAEEKIDLAELQKGRIKLRESSKR